MAHRLQPAVYWLEHAGPAVNTPQHAEKWSDGHVHSHPVLVGDVLLVRNGEEMAAFRLSLAGMVKSR